MSCRSTPPRATVEATAADAAPLLAGDDGLDVVAPHHYLVTILGQSNAEGIGDATDTTLDPTLVAPYPVVYDALVYSYVIEPIAARGYGDTPSGGTYALYDYGQLQPFYYGGGHYDFGIELTLGRDLDAAWPGRVAITKVAMGGSQLDTQWDPAVKYPAIGPNLAHRALARVRAAYEACGCDRLIVVWEQGEQDAQHLSDAEVYAAELGQLTALFRAQWPDALWVIGRLNSDAVNSGKAPYTSTVQDQEAAYVAGDPMSVLVDQDPEPLRTTDHLHYADQSYLDLGHLFAQAILARGDP